MQINWTLVAGLAALSLAAAASWDAGTAAAEAAHGRRGPWRVLALVHVALLAELVADTRFGVVAALAGAGRHMVQIGLALAMLAVAASATIAIGRVARRMPWFAPAGLAALAAAMLFGAETLSVRPIGLLLYRPVGPILLVGWLWLACGMAAVGVAILAVRRSSSAKRGGRPQP